MRLKRIVLVLYLTMAGCAQLSDSSLHEPAETPVRQTKPKPLVSASEPTNEHITPLLKLAGKWSVVRRDAQKPCALQLKTSQFGPNFAASSVCFGNPNIWSWNYTELTLDLFDNRGEHIASLVQNGAGSWTGKRSDTDATIHLVR